MRIKIELDAETIERLVKVSVAERRPLAWQAEVLLRRALGLPDTVAAAEEACNETGNLAVDRPNPGRDM